MFERFRNPWRVFRQERSGATAITFGLALIPLFGVVGAAVDYSRANATRTQLQAALDATALMLSKEAPGLTPAQVTQKANDYFNVAFTRPDALNTQLTVTYDPTGTSLTLGATAKVNTTIARVIGFNQFPIGSSTTVTWGATKLRITLVLDNTGSMNDSDSTGLKKITALKTASHQFLSLMQKAATKPDDIQIAIVPFAQFVKVDPALYRTKPWIDWSVAGVAGGDDDDFYRGTGCNGGDLSTPCQPGDIDWNGCFTDRLAPFDAQNKAPTSTNPTTSFPAVDRTPATIP